MQQHAALFKVSLLLPGVRGKVHLGTSSLCRVKGHSWPKDKSTGAQADEEDNLMLVLMMMMMMVMMKMRMIMMRPMVVDDVTKVLRRTRLRGRVFGS